MRVAQDQHTSRATILTTFPPDIPEDIRDEILDRMWRAHEARRRGALQECLEIAFDAFAESLTRAGWSLTHTLLWEQIPGWMLDWAIKWRWRPSLLFLDTQWTLELIRSHIAHRITYWEAKARFHQSAQPETSSAELGIVALFKLILEKKISAWRRGCKITQISHAAPLCTGRPWPAGSR